MAAGRAPRRPSARPLDRNHAAPELLMGAGVDGVLALELEPAVAADVENAELGWNGFDAVSVADRGRLDAGGDQHAAARLDAEGAQLDRAAVSVLDQGRLAARLINGKDGDIIFAPCERFRAVRIHQVR